MEEVVIRDERYTVTDANGTRHFLEALGDRVIKITDANGVSLFNPLSITSAFIAGLRDELLPMDDKLSIVSGAPGISYRTDNADLLLTPDEAYRLVMLALTPKEFFAIYAAVGNIYEIHNDFYDPDTGAAFQPTVDIPQGNFRVKNCFHYISTWGKPTIHVARIGYDPDAEPVPDGSGPKMEILFNTDTVFLGKAEFQQYLEYNPHIKHAVVEFTQEWLASPDTDALFANVNELANRDIDIFPVYQGVAQDDIVTHVPTLTGVDGLALPASGPYDGFGDSIAAALEKRGAFEAVGGEDLESAPDANESRLARLMKKAGLGRFF